MSFAIKIKQNNQNALEEIAAFSLFQKVTLLDDSFTIEKIDSNVTFLNASFSKATGSNLILKKRKLDYKLYQFLLINENGIEKINSTPEKLYFQIEPLAGNSIKNTQVKKIEFSLDEDFATVITNRIFYNHFNFKKQTNVPFNFKLVTEDNISIYEKTLTPFPVNPPENDQFIVSHSIEFTGLEPGFYEIDGEIFFFDQYQEIKHNHYIIKVLM